MKAPMGSSVETFFRWKCREQEENRLMTSFAVRPTCVRFLHAVNHVHRAQNFKRREDFRRTSHLIPRNGKVRSYCPIRTRLTPKVQRRGRGVAFRRIGFLLKNFSSSTTQHRREKETEWVSEREKNGEWKGRGRVRSFECPRTAIRNEGL